VARDRCRRRLQRVGRVERHRDDGSYDDGSHDDGDDDRNHDRGDDDRGDDDRGDDDRGDDDQGDDDRGDHDDGNHDDGPVDSDRRSRREGAAAADRADALTDLYDEDDDPHLRCGPIRGRRLGHSTHLAGGAPRKCAERSRPSAGCDAADA
jgi:hypothetical protein